MINLVVEDLDGALKQVEKGGAEVVGEIEEYDYGRFGWFIDPAGTRIELWQPPLQSRKTPDPAPDALIGSWGLLRLKPLSNFSRN